MICDGTVICNDHYLPDGVGNALLRKDQIWWVAIDCSF
jgi:hypothetical protein